MNNTTIDNSVSDAIKGSDKIFQTKNIVLPEKKTYKPLLLQRGLKMVMEKILLVHVFFKKHKFKKHEAQNAEILRNI